MNSKEEILSFIKSVRNSKNIVELIKKFSKLTNAKYKYDGNYMDIINAISSDLDNKISDDFLGQILKNYSKNN